MCSQIESIATNNKKAVLWLGGDLNLPDINWSTGSITGHQNTRAINERFLNMLHRTGLEQVVEFNTRKNVTLDLFLTNRPSLVRRCFAGPGIGQSDHDTVHLETDVVAPRRKPVRRRIHLWKRANLEDLDTSEQFLTASFLTEYTTESSVNEMWTFITESILMMMDKCVTSKMSNTRYTQPWCSTTIKRLSRQKRRCYNKAKTTNTKVHWTLLRHS